MRMRGSELVLQALEDEGTRFTFGIPGTHNIEVYDALNQSDQVTAVLVTDEQSAGFMADGVSRVSDHLGVVNLVPGAGVTHALSGIAEALLDNIPMVVLACGIRGDTGRAYQLHDIDQAALLRPVTKAVLKPTSPAEIYGTIRRAFDLARSGPPGPVAVELPADFLMLTHEVGEPLVAPAETPVPAVQDDRLQAAAQVLNAASRPILYVGYGARGAAGQLVDLAERLGSPVATTIQGKGVFPETHALWLWNGLGPSAPAFVREIGEQADAMLAIGCRFAEVGTASYGFTPPASLVHVDIDASVFNRNFPARVSIQGDAAGVVRALLPLLDDHGSWGPRAEHLALGHRGVMEAWARHTSLDRVTPAVLFATLQRQAPDAVFVTDSGNGTFLAMEHLRLLHPGRFLAPVDYSCMGYAVPAAIGAKLADPRRDVIAFAGDGALLMTGLELLTAAAYGAAPLVCVLRDGELAQIAQFQRTALAEEASSILPPFSVEALARTVGAEHVRLSKDSDAERAVCHALEIARAATPVMVDVAIDYSQKTYFTRGVVATTFWRLPWPERLRMLGRAAGRHIQRRLEPDW
ncbi:MAG: thiamine pyrophosphate-binding protein [Acidobacteriota bacterium]